MLQAAGLGSRVGQASVHANDTDHPPNATGGARASSGGGAPLGLGRPELLRPVARLHLVAHAPKTRRGNADALACENDM